MEVFSKKIWEDNYKQHDEKTVEDTWSRLAKAAAAVENKDIKKTIENKFYDILKDFKFIPGGRIMANLGVPDKKATTLMNCFVHHPKDIKLQDPDSIEGIYELLKAQAHTLKSEGGYGTNFSYIRPRGTYVNGIGTRTPGVLKFMELWDKSSEIITAGSEYLADDERIDEKKKIRKGAMMAILSIWHPEIEDFIKAKNTPGRLTKFNMSVGITDGFMECVIKNKSWKLIFPDINFNKYETEWNGDIDEWIDKQYPIKIYKTIKARDLWETIMYSTYTRNEPGVLFLDLANKLNPLIYGEKIFASNPCGEIGMSTGVCNLGSLNLVKFIKTCDDKVEFDFDLYKEHVKMSIRFLDNINDISRTPLKEYKNSMTEKRRIGLGNMGLGSLHFILGIEFGSQESMDLIEKIYKLKAETELLTSAKLAEEKESFSLFNKKEYFNTYWWKTLPIDDDVKKEIENIGKMRNSHHSMNAPTGNTSIYAGIVSGGIEPVFMPEYIRWSIVIELERAKLKEKGLVFPDVYAGEWFETKHFKFAKQGDEDILVGQFNGQDYMIDKNRGLVQSTIIEDYGWKFCKKFYTDIKLNELIQANVFKTTKDLSVNAHINTLKIISKYTNMNNSKTTNIPNNYSYEEFKNLYMDAWKSNIKGLTTYRAGTMTAVLDSIKQYTTDLEKLFVEAGPNIITDVPSLPNEAVSKTYILKDNNKKKWYVTITFVSELMPRPFALFINTNCKESNEVTDSFIKAMEAMLIKQGISKKKVEEQEQKYAGQSNITKISRIIGMALRHNISIINIVDVLNQFDIQISSFIFHLKKLLSKFIEDGTEDSNTQCPSCKQHTVVYNEGCKMCKDCGWTAC